MGLFCKCSDHAEELQNVRDQLERLSKEVRENNSVIQALVNSGFFRIAVAIESALDDSASKILEQRAVEDAVCNAGLPRKPEPSVLHYQDNSQ